MEKSGKLRKDYLSITAFYFFIFMSNSIYSYFIPLYLSEAGGYGASERGILLSITPFVAVFAQFFWGRTADRARYKNNVLLLLLGMTAVSVALLSLNTSLAYLAVMLALYSVFQTSVSPISDAIITETARNNGWEFGRLRLAGSMGFALMGLLAGQLLADRINMIFVIYITMVVVALIPALFMPKVKGYQKEKKRVSPAILLKNKPLCGILALSLLAQSTLGVYYSFFSNYFTEIAGGTKGQLGLAVFLASFCQIPFMLWAGRFIRKYGTMKLLVFATLVMALRWVLTGVVQNPVGLIAINCMHGMSFIVFQLCITIYIGDHVPAELRATGQAINAMITIGLSRIIGSMAGGFFIGHFGAGPVFVGCGLVNAAAALVIILLAVFKNSHSGFSEPTLPGTPS